MFTEGEYIPRDPNLQIPGEVAVALLGQIAILQSRLAAQRARADYWEQSYRQFAFDIGVDIHTGP